MGTRSLMPQLPLKAVLHLCKQSSVCTLHQTYCRRLYCRLQSKLGSLWIFKKYIGTIWIHITVTSIIVNFICTWCFLVPVFFSPISLPSLQVLFLSLFTKLSFHFILFSHSFLISPFYILVKGKPPEQITIISVYAPNTGVHPTT